MVIDIETSLVVLEVIVNGDHHCNEGCRGDNRFRGSHAMGVSKKQATDNKRSIVASAEKLFRKRGVDAVGLAELTKAAGFTQGGFYNHFKSKDALVAAVMEKAMEEGGETFASIVENAKAAGANPVRKRIEWY